MAQAQIEANKRFRKKSYDRIEITVPKGDREKIVQAASAAGMSVNAFIKEHWSNISPAQPNNKTKALSTNGRGFFAYQEESK